MIQSTKILLFFIVLALTNLALLAPLKAVDPTDTFYGTGAGNGTNTGTDDSGFGYDALHSITTGNENTANGSYALSGNTTGVGNTATGSFALYSNTTGLANTAIGDSALFENNTGQSNTASGYGALYSNTTGSGNTASGHVALDKNTTGSWNTACGVYSLYRNTTGNNNTAIGNGTLQSNITGIQNTGIGVNALLGNAVGNYNVAVGVNALYLSTGSFNVALGENAGNRLGAGSGNIYIGQGVTGTRPENSTTRIGNIYTSLASGRAVYVDADNKIGTLSSSRRFKEQIQPMEKASETLYGLKPVTFHYKKEVDPAQAPSFGLIAEDVNKVDPDLITRDQKGEPETVRYEAVNAMLLNEFLKEHRKVEQLEKQVEALTAGLQKVSAQLALSKPAPQTVRNQ